VVWLLGWIAILDDNEPVVQVGTYCSQQVYTVSF
jgi:hypothetical protein